jgi:hypothetical protein
MEWVVDLGSNPNDEPKLLRACYSTSDISLWRDDLLEAVLSAGADNLHVFPAILCAKHDKNQIYTNYKGVNIVGAIEAMVTPETKTVSLADGNVFPEVLEGLYLDTNAPDGTRIFRLAEARRSTIVHERVKREIEKRKIPYVWFRDQGEWHG